MKTLKEILAILHKSGYIKFQLKNNAVSNLEFTSPGSILLQNIQKEWTKNKNDLNTYFNKSNFKTNSTLFQNYDTQINFINSQDFKANFLFAKNKFKKKFPLAIKTFCMFDKQYQNVEFGIELMKKNFMICNYFFSEAQAYKEFSKIQRERKIWWMKLFVNPKRIYLSNLKTEVIKKNKLQSVKIKAKFNFGDIELENICVIPMKMTELGNNKDYHLFDSKTNKAVVPVVIYAEVCSEIAAIVILFDAVENSKNEKICLQRNVAPYQCCIFTFSLFEGDEKNLRDLEDLAIHLSNILRKSNIRTLNLHKSILIDYKALQTELNKIDKIGVPYSIIIDSVSLQNGLMKLRNRDTTLSETIHITDVPSYLIKIFNSF